MRRVTTYIISRQNFAVAENRAPLTHRHGRQKLLVLTRRRVAAWWRWWKLYRDDAVWTDPRKRAAMIRARWAYQDAVLAWLEAARSESHPETQQERG